MNSVITKLLILIILVSCKPSTNSRTSTNSESNNLNKALTTKSTGIITCIFFTYSNWSTCLSNNTQSRSVLSSSPANCVGGNPITEQVCNDNQSLVAPSGCYIALALAGSTMRTNESKTLTVNCLQGNSLNYLWKDKNSSVTLGTTQSLVVSRPSAGTHNYTVSVSNAKSSQVLSQAITVDNPVSIALSRNASNSEDRFFASTESSSIVAKRYWSKVNAQNHGGNNKRTVAFWGAPVGCNGDIGPSVQFELNGDKYFPSCAGSTKKGPSFDADVFDMGTWMHQIHTEASIKNSTSAFLFPYDNLGQTGGGTNAHLTATYVDLNPSWTMKPWRIATANDLSTKTRAVFIARQKTSAIQLMSPGNSQLQQVVSFGFLNTACFSDVSIRNASPTICQFQINLKTFNKGINAFVPNSNAELYSDAAQGSIGVILGPIGPSGHKTRFADGQVAWTSFGDEMQTNTSSAIKKFQIEITWEEALVLFKKLSHNNPNKFFGPTWNIGRDWVLINAQYGQEVYRDPSVVTPTFVDGYFQDLEVLSLSDSTPVTCSEFNYSAWGACQSNNTQTRSVVGGIPANCTGGNPITSQSCTYVPPVVTCSTFNYSAWGVCQSNNTQSRSVTGGIPANCTGGNPITSQSCTYVPPVVTCSTFNYSAWGACQSNNTQTRSVAGGIPANCTGGNPITSQSCTYVPPVVTCSTFNYSAWGACQSNNTQTRSVAGGIPANCTGGNPITSQSCTYVLPKTCTTGTFQYQNQTYEYSCDCGVVADGVLQSNGCYHRLVAPVTCSTFNYSAWGACQSNNTQTRSVTGGIPANCTGGNPITGQSCNYVPPVVTCSTFNYSAWGACQSNNTQTRSVVGGIPANCTGGNPITSQSCTYVPPVVTCSTFNYSAWGVCQSNNTQTRSVVGGIPANCTGGNPITSQSCTYVPPVVTCSTFNYSAWGVCQSNNTQTRSVVGGIPANCTGGNPITSQSCTYVPPTTCTKGTFLFQNKTYEFSCGCGFVSGGVLQSDGCYHRPVQQSNCTTGTFQFQNQTYEFSCNCGYVPDGVLQSNGCYHRAAP